MNSERFIKLFLTWLKEKITGEVRIKLHEGGIRNVRLEQDIK